MFFLSAGQWMAFAIYLAVLLAFGFRFDPKLKNYRFRSFTEWMKDTMELAITLCSVIGFPILVWWLLSSRL